MPAGVGFILQAVKSSAGVELGAGGWGPGGWRAMLTIVSCLQSRSQWAADRRVRARGLIEAMVRKASI